MNQKHAETVSDILHLIVLRLRPDRMETWSKKLKGLTPLQLHILKLAQDSPGLAPADILREFDIPQTTLSSALDRLVKRGLLVRRINERDLRSFAFELTDEGKEIQAEHERVDMMIAKLLLGRLDDELERAEFIRLLKKIMEGLG